MWTGTCPRDLQPGAMWNFVAQGYPEINKKKISENRINAINYHN